MLFEQFVRQLFNEQNFNLIKWRKFEKLEDKILLDDCVNPDNEKSDGQPVINLIPYKRKPTRKFFYDTIQLKLF